MEKQRESLWLVVILLGGGFFMMFAFILVLMLAFVGIEADFSGGDKIGVIEVVGVIEDSSQIIKDMRDFADDENVKGILLRVDSPGGGVAPSQEIYQEVLKIKEDIPVVVSMGSLAASGGYYISCGASRIFANPGTITGSIGVIIQSTNLEELMKFVKVKPVVFKSGKHKDILSPFRETSESDRAIINGMIADVYDQFISAVSETRNIDKEELKKIADGRIISGRQAFEAHLVDQLGSFTDALDYLAGETNLGDDYKLAYPKKDSLGFIEKMFESTLQGVLKGINNHQSSQTLQYKMN